MIKKQLKENPIEFKSLKDFKEIKNNYQTAQKVKFNCRKCNKEVIRFVSRISYLIKKDQFNFLCKDCQRKETSLKIYGVENPNDAEIVKEKAKNTKIKNNSVNSEKRLKALKEAFKTRNEEIQKKRKQTNLEKYGQLAPLYEVTCPFCNKKMDNTHLTRHKKGCEKNPDNFIEEEKNGIVPLTDATIQKLNKLTKTLRAHKKVSYICQSCKQKVILKSFNWFKSFNTCPACERKQTCNEKYGGNSSFASKEVRKRIQKICLDRYGVAHPIQNKDILNKRKQTNLKRYGVEEVGQNKEIRAKQIETLTSKTKEEKEAIQEKRKGTMLDKYGVEYALQNKDLKKRARKSYEKTCLERYGMLHAPRSTYTYNDEKFDSIPELAFYIYCKNNGKNIIRCPTEFKYVFNGKEHYYLPDFQIDDQIIEIKGGSFLTEENTWQNPYNHSLDDLMEAKHQCALKNNVKVLYYTDYKKYLDYIIDTYGSLDYLQQFKNGD